jgi:uncharacterized protein YdeI (YjbR/CyaY-like superfamily)
MLRPNIERSQRQFRMFPWASWRSWVDVAFTLDVEFDVGGDRLMADAGQRLEMPNRAAWRCWLATHHASSPSVWLQFPKEGSPDRLTYVEAVEEALCFGWIDGQVRGIDTTRYLRLFSRRRPTSDWSKLNKQRVEALTRAGLMTAVGLAAIETAKANGSWTRLDLVEQLAIPDDLATALASDPEAERNFAGFPTSAKKEYLYWVISAKRSTSRQDRIQAVVALAGRNQPFRYA